MELGLERGLDSGCINTYESVVIGRVALFRHCFLSTAPADCGVNIPDLFVLARRLFPNQ